MSALNAVRSYVNVRIIALEREQGEHAYNEKQLNELRDMRTFLDCIDEVGKENTNTPSIEECLSLLAILDKAEAKFKKKAEAKKEPREVRLAVEPVFNKGDK